MKTQVTSTGPDAERPETPCTACGWPRNPVQLLQRPGRQVLGERKGRRVTRRFRSCDRPRGGENTCPHEGVRVHGREIHNRREGGSGCPTGRRNGVHIRTTAYDPASGGNDARTRMNLGHVSRSGGGRTPGHAESFPSDENVLKLTAAMVVQCCDYTRNTEL